MIELERVTRDFTTPGGASYSALRDVSLAIPRGAFVAIVGPSGCGKSTLLNITAGLLSPTSGRVRIDGENLGGLNRRATYMFQQDALLPWKNVRDNVALGLTLGGMPQAEARSRAGEWLARVGLQHFAGHYPSQLSGGMRKRVTMAQNWMLDRDIVLMDEPFGALDVHTRQRMEAELLVLWDATGSDPGSRENGTTARSDVLSRPRRSRKTVVFVTHDLEEAISLADEVVILSAGPASHIVAQHPITLDRPRDLVELRTAPAFVDVYRSVWALLRDEVIRSHREGAGA
jgi:NitT/TauT family transport system ATP-binding protein